MEGLSKFNLENKIEKSEIKKGVDFVFEQSPELAQIGTKELYSEYLNTIFPDSKIKDIVYHGGADGIDNFKNPFEHDGKKFHSTLSFNKKRYGMYFTDKYKEAKDYANTYGMNGYKPKVYPTMLNMRNPIKGKDVILYGMASLKNIAKLINKNYVNFQSITEKDVENFKENDIDGIEWIGKNQFIVVDSNQIYILGSRQDLENFKKFAGNKKD